MDTSEKRFEQDIESYFLNHCFRKVLPSTYDKEKMLFSDVLRLNLKHGQDILSYMVHQL